MSSLDELSDAHPLPGDWKKPELYEEVAETPSARLLLTGLTADHPRYGRVFAAAADFDEPQLLRCYFELLERVGILEAENREGGDFELKDQDDRPTGRISSSDLFPSSETPAIWQYSKSNGVAAHRDWGSACRNAQLELVERDRLLRSWYGQIQPAAIAFEPPVTDPRYRFRMYAFASPRDPCPIFVHGLFAFPLSEEVLFAYGTGAGWSPEDATRKASREFLQMYGFLLGEKTETEAPPFAPNPSYHQAMNFRPESREKIGRWLEGAHSAFASAPETPGRAEPETRYADITPPSLASRIFIAKAVCPRRLPLTFGRARLRGAEKLPEELLVHPFV
ncbi:MAG TPA: YcaO-like family protein [bacterium]|nr:YcaO-like family protein [bacterium]